MKNDASNHILGICKLLEKLEKKYSGEWSVFFNIHEGHFWCHVGQSGQTKCAIQGCGFKVIQAKIDHFTVVGLVTWPLNGSEAGVDLVLIQTSLLLLCKSSCCYANQFAFIWEKQGGLYQSKVTSNLACIHGQVTKHTTVKWPIVLLWVKYEWRWRCNHQE